MNTTYPTFHLKKIDYFCRVEYSRKCFLNGQNNLNIHITFVKEIFAVATLQCGQISSKSHLSFFQAKLFLINHSKILSAYKIFKVHF